MGVITPSEPIPPGQEQDVLLRAATEELQDRGFIVSSLDSLVNGCSPFCRTGREADSRSNAMLLWRHAGGPVR